ncbi:hypothetical protein BJX70DRAFT_373287 [Aspergillus crustosus]
MSLFFSAVGSGRHSTNRGRLGWFARLRRRLLLRLYLALGHAGLSRRGGSGASLLLDLDLGEVSEGFVLGNGEAEYWHKGARKRRFGRVTERIVSGVKSLGLIVLVG